MAQTYTIFRTILQEPNLKPSCLLNTAAVEHTSTQTLALAATLAICVTHP